MEVERGKYNGEKGNNSISKGRKAKYKWGVSGERNLARSVCIKVLRGEKRGKGAKYMVREGAVNINE